VLVWRGAEFRTAAQAKQRSYVETECSGRKQSVETAAAGMGARECGRAQNAKTSRMCGTKTIHKFLHDRLPAGLAGNESRVNVRVVRWQILART
jgi:hypothetical protein